MSAIDQSLLTARVYAHLRERIVNKSFPAGARLAEETISAELEVSRTPVREALHRLTQEGFVVYTPRRGCRVKLLSRREVKEIFELRSILEPLALREAWPRISPADIARLGDRLAELDRISAGRRSQAALAADDDLHNLFCQGCSNRYLRECLRRLIQLSRPYRSFGASAPAHLRQLHRQRQQILAALRAGRNELAGHLLQRHIRAGQQAILTRMQGYAN